MKHLIESFIRSILSEKMMRENFDNYAKLVTAAYAARPVLEEEAVGLWKALADHNEKMMRKVRSRIDVEFVDNYDDIGYETAEEMNRRVKDEKKMIVDTRFSDHQVWTKEQNWVFRAVHDYIVHIGGGHPFGLRGELASYNLHAKLVPVSIRPAIFSEVVGQVCTEIVTGNFPDPQKVCILHGFDYTKVGSIDPEEYVRNFESEEQMYELMDKFGATAEWGREDAT